MKIREGFISNSSSTSFIAIINDDKKTKVTLSFEVDLKDYVDRYIATIDELNDYFICDYGEITSNPVLEIEKILKDNDDLKEKYDKMKNGIEQGKTILVANISSEGEPEEQFLYDYGIANINAQSKEIEILE